MPSIVATILANAATLHSFLSPQAISIAGQYSEAFHCDCIAALCSDHKHGKGDKTRMRRAIFPVVTISSWG